ncbi:DegT/DnrJ/EryC1/StrS family aminotransferase [Candidatus Uhrbacteria bacterium]|nr:DegT/DnrJ/EryC1/StrS family aminotransferase [Candidatus Uhrbacteria bacterium]
MFVPVSRPLLGKEETELVMDVMSRGEISGFSGSRIKEFETRFAEFCGTSHAVTVSSGTAALHLALATLRIGLGDEVLVSTFTNMATFFAVLYQGATPIPIDMEAHTLNMDPRLLEQKITPRTKAILPVHLFGHPVNMDPVLDVARRHNLFVIEDAAEAHGATYKGKRVGSLGDIGCFSFYANKIVTTGEGGMVTTNRPELAERARMLKSLAFGTENKFMHQDVGYNYRLTNLQAAVGVAQMGKIDDILRRKKEMAAYYLRELAGISAIQLPVEEPYASNVYWMFNIVLRGPLSGKRTAFMAALKERGVETREDFVPFNLQDIFIARGLTKPEDCPVANDISKDGLYLPSGTDISEPELAHVVASVREVVTALGVA